MIFPFGILDEAPWNIPIVDLIDPDDSDDNDEYDSEEYDDEDAENDCF